MAHAHRTWYGNSAENICLPSTEISTGFFLTFFGNIFSIDHVYSHDDNVPGSFGGQPWAHSRPGPVWKVSLALRSCDRKWRARASASEIRRRRECEMSRGPDPAHVLLHGWPRGGKGQSPSDFTWWRMSGGPHGLPGSTLSATCKGHDNDWSEKMGFRLCQCVTKLNGIVHWGK